MALKRFSRSFLSRASVVSLSGDPPFIMCVGSVDFGLGMSASIAAGNFGLYSIKLCESASDGDDYRSGEGTSAREECSTWRMLTTGRLEKARS
jgi:hypothetical protein